MPFSLFYGPKEFLGCFEVQEKESVALHHDKVGPSITKKYQ
jgi:hypothetical protein